MAVAMQSEWLRLRCPVCRTVLADVRGQQASVRHLCRSCRRIWHYDFTSGEHTVVRDAYQPPLDKQNG